MESKQVKVGVGVIVINDQDHVLVGKRLSKLGHGEWALPGGHLEYGETFEQCATRELEEETGIVLDTLPKFEYAVNTIFQDQGSQYVTIFMKARLPQGAVAQVMEPDKCEGWEWVSFDSIPQPLFKPLQVLIESDYVFNNNNSSTGKI